MGKGYERIYMPEGLQVYLIQNPAHIKPALQVLRASMQVRLDSGRVTKKVPRRCMHISKEGAYTDALITATKSQNLHLNPTVCFCLSVDYVICCLTVGCPPASIGPSGGH